MPGLGPVRTSGAVVAAAGIGPVAALVRALHLIPSLPTGWRTGLEAPSRVCIVRRCRARTARSLETEAAHGCVAPLAGVGTRDRLAGPGPGPGVATTGGKPSSLRSIRSEKVHRTRLLLGVRVRVPVPIPPLALPPGLNAPPALAQDQAPKLAPLVTQRQREQRRQAAQQVLPVDIAPLADIRAPGALAPALPPPLLLFLFHTTGERERDNDLWRRTWSLEHMGTKRKRKREAGPIRWLCSGAAGHHRGGAGHHQVLFLGRFPRARPGAAGVYWLEMQVT